MKSHPRLPSPPLFARRDLFRLMSMLTLLAVVGMLIYRSADPSMWRWMAADVREESDTDAHDEPFVETMLTGPNDLQPFEQSQAEYLFQAVTDKAPIAAEEMPAYWKLMRWSRTQSFDEMWQRARRDRYFTHFAEAPETHRGELIALKLSLRRSVRHDKVSKNSAEVKEVYEAWGVTDESRSELYGVVFNDRPPQIPIAPNIHEEALFVGYFFKLMLTQDGLGKMRWAPMLIGRLRWRENLAQTALRRQREDKFTWPVIWGGAVALVVAIGFWTKSYLSQGQVPQTSDPQVNHAAIEQWLETGGSADESASKSLASLLEEMSSETDGTEAERRPTSLPKLDFDRSSGAVTEEKPA